MVGEQIYMYKKSAQIESSMEIRKIIVLCIQDTVLCAIDIA